MRGKDKCRALREIRKQIAEQNDIKLVTEECKFKGECKGTCPKCEAELKYLEDELAKRRNLGKRIAVAGVAAGTALAMSGCALEDAADLAIRLIGQKKAPEPEIIELMGDVPDIYEYEMGEMEYCPDDE